MKRSVFALISILFLVIAISGCIDGASTGTTPITGGTSATGTTHGLELKDFSAFPYVDEGDIVDVSLHLENIGGGTASDVSVDLYQHADFIISSTEPPERGFRQNLGGVLMPPDLEFGMIGEDWPLFWLLKAPSVSSDTSKNLNARISYTYGSSSSTNAYLVSKAEYDEKGADSFPTYSTFTEGSLTIEIVSIPPFRLSDPSTTSKRVEFDIIFENTGNGVVENDKVYDFQVKLNGDLVVCNDENKDTDKDGLSDALEENYGFDSQHKETFRSTGKYDKALFLLMQENGSLVSNTEFSLWGDKQERGIECEIDLGFDGASVSHIVEVSGKYDYHFDTSPLTITVQNE